MHVSSADPRADWGRGLPLRGCRSALTPPPRSPGCRRSCGVTRARPARPNWSGLDSAKVPHRVLLGVCVNHAQPQPGSAQVDADCLRHYSPVQSNANPGCINNLPRLVFTLYSTLSRCCRTSLSSVVNNAGSRLCCSVTRARCRRRSERIASTRRLGPVRSARP